MSTTIYILFLVCIVSMEWESGSIYIILLLCYYDIRLDGCMGNCNLTTCRPCSKLPTPPLIPCRLINCIMTSTIIGSTSTIAVSCMNQPYAMNRTDIGKYNSKWESNFARVEKWRSRRHRPHSVRLLRVSTGTDISR